MACSIAVAVSQGTSEWISASGAADQQGAEGEGEGDGQPGVADEQRRRVQDHAEMQQERVQTGRQGPGGRLEERVGALVDDRERGEHRRHRAEHHDGRAG
jgi:hypothetical protein